MDGGRHAATERTRQVSVFHWPTFDPPPQQSHRQQVGGVRQAQSFHLQTRIAKQKKERNQGNREVCRRIVTNMKGFSLQ